MAIAAPVPSVRRDAPTSPVRGVRERGGRCFATYGFDCADGRRGGPAAPSALAPPPLGVALPAHAVSLAGSLSSAALEGLPSSASSSPPAMEMIMQPPWPEDTSELKHWSSLIQDFSKQNCWANALGVLSQMRHSGSMPSTTTYATALGACYRSRQWEKALELLADMQHHGVKADTAACGFAAGSCALGLVWERALRTTDEMRAGGVRLDAFACCAGLAACEKGQRWAEALTLLEDLRHTYSPPPRQPRPGIATAVGSAFGDVVRAAKSMESVDMAGSLPIANMYSSGDPCAANIGSNANRGCSTACFVAGFGAAVRTCATARAWGRALELLTELRQDGLACDPSVLTATCHALLRECEESGEWTKASAFLEELPRCEWPVELLLKIRSIESNLLALRPHDDAEQIEDANAAQRRLGDIFSRCDLNGDGSFNKNELIKLCRLDSEVADFFGCHNEGRQEDEITLALEKCFKGIDNNGDRQISWEEFRSWFVETIASPGLQGAEQQAGAAAWQELTEPIVEAQCAAQLQDRAVVEEHGEEQEAPPAATEAEVDIAYPSADEEVMDDSIGDGEEWQPALKYDTIIKGAAAAAMVVTPEKQRKYW